MSERDELADLVADITSCGGCAVEGFHCAQCLADTDQILAAGYRKQRTITTTEELNSLAEGSVILSNGGEDSAQKDGEGYWYLWGGDIGLCPEEINLPATVLHDPEASL